MTRPTGSRSRPNGGGHPRCPSGKRQILAAAHKAGEQGRNVCCCHRQNPPRIVVRVHAAVCFVEDRRRRLLAEKLPGKKGHDQVPGGSHGEMSAAAAHK